MGKHYKEVYLLAILDNTYLVAKSEGQSIMVWDNIEKLKSDLISIKGLPLLGLKPTPVRVTREQFPGVEDMYLNEFICHLTDSTPFDILPFKEIDELPEFLLLPINEEKVREYLLPY